MLQLILCDGNRLPCVPVSGNSSEKPAALTILPRINIARHPARSPDGLTRCACIARPRSAVATNLLMASESSVSEFSIIFLVSPPMVPAHRGTATATTTRTHAHTHARMPHTTPLFRPTDRVRTSSRQTCAIYPAREGKAPLAPLLSSRKSARVSSVV